MVGWRERLTCTVEPSEIGTRGSTRAFKVDPYPALEGACRPDCLSSMGRGPA